MQMRNLERVGIPGHKSRLLAEDQRPSTSSSSSSIAISGRGGLMRGRLETGGPIWKVPRPSRARGTYPFVAYLASH
jgi:hypothetical protein